MKARILVELSSLEPVDLSSMRTASFEHAAKWVAGGRFESRPVRVDYYPDRRRGVLSDGRHRVLAAMQAGQATVWTTFTWYGPRGGRRDVQSGYLHLDRWPRGSSSHAELR